MTYSGGRKLEGKTLFKTTELWWRPYRRGRTGWTRACCPCARGGSPWAACAVHSCTSWRTPARGARTWSRRARNGRTLPSRPPTAGSKTSLSVNLHIGLSSVWAGQEYIWAARVQIARPIIHSQVAILSNSQWCVSETAINSRGSRKSSMSDNTLIFVPSLLLGLDFIDIERYLTTRFDSSGFNVFQRTIALNMRDEVSQ